MLNLKVETDLNLTHQQNNYAVSKLIRGSIKRKSQHEENTENSERQFYWPASSFLLDSVAIYQKLNNETQQKILTRYNEVLLSDFYFLEKSGMAYCAKMILLGETTEIRQLYGLIASDEAMHLEWFTPYVRQPLRTKPQGKLLPVLGKIIEDCDANTLYYLVQTIIEGWGFVTYKTLSKDCLCLKLKSTLKQVMQDEAIHHKAGPALFDPRKIDNVTSTFIFDRMKAYAEVLRVGPQTLIQCIEEEVGDLNVNELEEIFDQLKTQITTQLKLNLLKELMFVPGMEHFVQSMSEAGFTKPYLSSQCARIYQQTRGKSQYII